MMGGVPEASDTSDSSFSVELQPPVPHRASAMRLLHQLLSVWRQDRYRTTVLINLAAVMERMDEQVGIACFLLKF